MRKILAVLVAWSVLGGLVHAQPFQTSRTYNVVSLGAIANDGNSDTTAIQAAIDAAEADAGANGGRATVLIPPGVYHVTTLTFDNPHVIVSGYGARLEQLSGSGFNQMIYVKGEADSDDASDIIIRGLTIDGNYPAINNSGSGIGFNIRGHDVQMIDVTAEATEDATFIAANCMRTKFQNCKSVDAGRTAFRLRGDQQSILHCEAYNWNCVNDNNGNRAILIDSQEADVEWMVVDDFYAEEIHQHVGMEVFLVDCGDGSFSVTNAQNVGNSGGASNDNGKAQFTIDAGHGFMPGDGFKVTSSSVTGYNIAHKINKVTGNCFIRKVDDDTFQLYSTSLNAIKDNDGAGTGSGGEDGLGDSTNRYNITDSGTGTFYVKAAGALRKQFTVASTTDDTFTCVGHGFTTGTQARLTLQDQTADVLPTGLANVALITTNTDYTSAGTGAQYWRQKRVKNLTWHNVRALCISPDGEDGAIFKTNNCHNVSIDRMVANVAQDYGGNGFISYRIGPGNRKVVVTNSKLPLGIDNNTTAWCPEVTIENCEIGDGGTNPDNAIDLIQVARLTVRKNKLRFTSTGIETPGVSTDLRFADIDRWVIEDNDFEGVSTSRTNCLILNTTAHMNMTGKLRWYNNTRRNMLYSGLTVTTASSDTCTATNHTLETGDIVYFTTTGALDAAITASTPYYIRRTGDNTFTIHTSLEGASNNTDRVNITGAGTPTHTLHTYSGKLGCNLANSNPIDRMLYTKDASGKNFLGATVPTSTSIGWTLGDIVWNMNPVTGGSPGWICTKTGLVGTSAGTFEPLPAGSRTYSIATYGAWPDDAVDDTTAVQAAVDAAEAYTAANPGSEAEVIVPAGVFLVGSGISVGSSAVEIGADGVSNYVTMRGEGCLKLYDGSSADAVVELVGDHCRLQGIRVDGNASGSPAGRGEGVRVNGDYNHVVGVIAQNTKTTGSTGTTFEIFGSPCVGNVIERCTSLNSGYMAFENRGDYTTFRDIVLLEYLGHGFGQAGGNKNELTIDGIYSSSSVSTLDCLVIDPGYTTDSTKDGYKLERLKLSNATFLGGASMAAGMKISRVSHASLDNVSVIHSTTGYSSLKLAESIGKIDIRDSFFSRDINQDGSPTDATGTLTGATTDNGGYAKFACTGHDVKSGDYIVMDGTTNYDGLQLVTDSETNAFTTTRKYVGAESSGTWYSAIGEINLENVIIGDRVHTGFSGSVNGVRASRLNLNRCQLRNYQNFAIGLDSNLSAADVFSEITVNNCDAESYDSSGTCVFLAWDTGSGVVVNNTDIVKIDGLKIQDKGSVSTTGVTGVADRQLVVSANRTMTGFDSGKTFIIGANDLTITLPAVSGLSGVGSGCVYRFVLRSDGLSTGTGLSLSPNSADQFYGNGFTPLDNKDAILSGASDRAGDTITIVSDGQDGWIITNVIGTWTRE